MGLELNSEYGYAVGANIDPTAIEVTSVDFSGRYLDRKTVPLVSQERQSIIESAIENIAAMFRGTGSGAGRCLGVGIGVTGLVDTASGVVLYSPILPGWENVDLSSAVGDALSAEVVVDDSVRCMALAEKRYGNGRGESNYLYLYAGHGVGSAIMLGDRLYRGRNGVAGEIGHVTVRENGVRCSCGNHGCLETLVSSSAVLREVEKSIGENVHTSLIEWSSTEKRLTLEDLAREADKGDKLANIVISHVGEDIGIGLADIVNVLDPGVVILGGEVIESFGDSLMERIQGTVALRGINAITRRTRLCRSELGVNSAARGAATLVIERFLGDPIVGL